jgi:hypothetical protein
MSIRRFFTCLFLVCYTSFAFADTHNTSNTTFHHFNKIMVVVFENMSYAEIKNAPIFQKLVEYSGSTLSVNGLQKRPEQIARRDIDGNGYAFFSNYHNNHAAGSVPSRSSQPNYFAMTSGSVQNIGDNNKHDLNVDNLAKELIEANISWKVYAEDLPDPKTVDPKVEQSTFFTGVKEKIANLFNYFKKPDFNKISGCYIGEYYSKDNHDKDHNGYARKHEPFISYLDIQNNGNYCKNIVNAKHLSDDVVMSQMSFYIPNQINDGHNGKLDERTRNANRFLSLMMGMDPKTSELLFNASEAPFRRFMAQNGLLVITFDEPSTTGNPDQTIYHLLAGKMINSGTYAPTCYPDISKQTKYPRDKNGDYDPSHCNHYNLLKMIEANWNLRGLIPTHTSAGYKYAYSLDASAEKLWK